MLHLTIKKMNKKRFFRIPGTKEAFLRKVRKSGGIICYASRWNTKIILEGITQEKYGADEGIRTLDPNLGKVMLYP